MTDIQASHIEPGTILYINGDNTRVEQINNSEDLVNLHNRVTETITEVSKLDVCKAIKAGEYQLVVLNKPDFKPEVDLSVKLDDKGYEVETTYFDDPELNDFEDKLNIEQAAKLSGFPVTVLKYLSNPNRLKVAK